MASRSTVAIALKAQVSVLLPSQLRDYLNGRADKHLVTEEGHAFWLLENIKWDLSHSFFAEMQFALGKFLTESTSFTSEDYIIRDACHGDPDSDVGDWGSWEDNPWFIQKYTTVEIDYESVGHEPGQKKI